MQAVANELSEKNVGQAVDAILEVLGNPLSPLHTEAMEAFKSGNHARVKRLASTNLSDYYCKALGYLSGALKLTPNTDTILAESARAASDYVREKTLQQLGIEISKALG